MEPTIDSVAGELQRIADSTDSLILSFIAPEVAIKRTPTSSSYAQITATDLYVIEKELIKIKKEHSELPNKLKIVIHTPGGSTFYSTKIAKYLRSKFQDITAYVPYEASSGGTVLCLGANRIVMDEISSLTPIDSQVPYKGTYISVASYEQAILDIAKKFETTSPGDLPAPYSNMCERLDPVIMKEMKKKVLDGVFVAVSLLNKHIDKKDRALEIAFGLVKTDFSHNHIIDMEEAEELGLELEKSQQELEYLDIFKLWVGEHLNDRSDNHIVKPYVPRKKSRRVAKRGKKP
jgi:hypothetical protein